MATKDFDLDVQEALAAVQATIGDEENRVTFHLGGADWRLSEGIPGVFYFEFVAAALEGQRARQQQIALKVLTLGVHPEERLKFRAMLEGPEGEKIAFTVLDKVIDWMFQQFSGRPQNGPTESSPGPSETGNSSEGGGSNGTQEPISETSVSETSSPT